MSEARSDGTAKAQAGQFLVAGVEDPELMPTAQALDFLEEIAPFGVILFKRNTPSLEATLGLTGALAERLPEALLSIDHEGGRVNRLPSPFTHFPPMLALTRHGDPGLIRDAARAMAAELRAAGFHISYAPCLDIWTNPDNAVIGDRAFGETPEEVIHNAIPYYQGLIEGGVMGCGKHFPGHGDTQMDSHEDMPRVTHSLDRLRSLEMVPFARAISQGFAMMMSAHLLCDAIDSELPVSLSPKALQDHLRGALGYRGVICTDDMEMGAITKHFGMGEAAVRAVEAGNDLLLVCRRPDLVREARNAIADAIDAGRISPALLAAAQRRRTKLRKRVLKLAAEPVSAEVIGAGEHQELASRFV